MKRLFLIILLALLPALARAAVEPGITHHDELLLAQASFLHRAGLMPAAFSLRGPVPPPPPSATDIYLSQSGGSVSCGGAGTQSTSAYTFFNSGANWGTGSTQIGAGTVVHLCGTINPGGNTTALTFQGGGSVGNLVEVRFESGSSLQSSTYFPAGTGAIACTSHNYVRVNGQNVGVIKNLDNGSAALGFGNQQPSDGIEFSACSNSEIENLTVQNLFVRQAGAATYPQDLGNGHGTAIGLGDASNSSIHGNTVSDDFIGIGSGTSGAGTENAIDIYNNSVNKTCHMINVGAGSNGATLTNFNLYGNTIGNDYNTWIYAGSDCHQDAMIIGSILTGLTITNWQIYNNKFLVGACTASGGNFTSPGIFASGPFNHLWVYNNLFYSNVVTNGCAFEGYIALDPNGQTINDLEMFNNTVDENGVNPGTATMNWWILRSGAGGTGTNFLAKNNIVENIPSSGNAAYLNEQDTFRNVFGGSTNLDYNFDYNLGEYGLEFANNQHYTCFTGTGCWQNAAASPNNFPGYDTHGSTANPNLDANHVPNNGAPVIGAGVNLTSLCGSFTALCSDAAGNPRPSSNGWTVGAYNFGTPPPTTPTPQLAPKFFARSGINYDVRSH